MRARRGAPWGAAAVLALAAAAPARAQAPAAPARAGVTNQTLWISYVGDHALRPGARTGLHLEAQARRADLGAAWQQRLARVGLTHTPGGGVRLAAGYAYVDTERYGDAPVAAPFPEHRAWQQLQLGHATGAVSWTHRYRLEQRWIGRTGTGVADAGRVVGWRYANRARYLARGAVPLGALAPALDDARLVVANELFVNFGRSALANLLDQNRAMLLLSHPLGGALRVEGGYLHQYLVKGSGRDVERNHTIVLTLASTAPLLR